MSMKPVTLRPSPNSMPALATGMRADSAAATAPATIFFQVSERRGDQFVTHGCVLLAVVEGVPGPAGLEHVLQRLWDGRHRGYASNDVARDNWCGRQLIAGDVVAATRGQWRMVPRQRIVRERRQYNQWVATQTLEDYALRYTAAQARQSDVPRRQHRLRPHRLPRLRGHRRRDHAVLRLHQRRQRHRWPSAR